MISRIERTFSNFSASEPETAAGSGKGQCQRFEMPGKDRTLGFGIIANRNDMIEKPALFEQLQDALGFLPGQVHTGFGHHPNHQRVYGLCGFQTGALNFEVLSINISQEGLGDLAAAAVVLADEKNFDLAVHCILHGV